MSITTPANLNWQPHIAGTKIHMVEKGITLIRFDMNSFELWDRNQSSEPIPMDYKQLTEYLNEE